MFGKMLQDLGYAVKMIQSVCSGYFFLEYKSDGEWQPIGLRLEPHSIDGVHGLYPHFDLEDNPYYVCAVFANGRHIPLPIVLGDTEEIGPFQRLALRLLNQNKQMESARMDCAYYENQFCNENPELVAAMELL